jgi:hypothetical protein
MAPDTPGRPQFTLAATLVVVAAAAVTLAIGVAAGWFTATVVAAAAVLSAILAFGWYHAVAPSGRANPTAADHHWFYVALLGAVIAVAPFVPVLVLKGMDHYAYASVLRQLRLAPNDNLRDTR